MRISLNELEVFSQCPAKHAFSVAGETPRNDELEICREVVKKAYLKATETGYRSEWRRIVGWVDKLAFKNVDMLEKDSYKAGKQLSEHCLVFLRTWYEALYLKEDVVSYVDVEIDTQIGEFTFYETIPIIKTDGDDVQILDITDVPRENRQLFNSVYARGMAMLLSEQLLMDYISVVSIAVGDRGGFKVSDIKTKIEDHARIRQRLVAMASALRDIRDPYPSVGEQCRSCPYKWRCVL